jgi:anti-sigma B factor antagonist
MSLRIATREVDGVSIVTLSGRIVFGEDCNGLRSKVKSLIAEGKQKIVLNMKGIEYIDSAGLGMLVAAHISMKTHDAVLRLCWLSNKFQEALRITRLSTVFQVYSTEAAAVASFLKPNLIAVMPAADSGAEPPLS